MKNVMQQKSTVRCMNCITHPACVCRAEVADTVENVDMSLEELQHLLLRSHQQNAVEAGTSAVMDVSRYLRHQADRCQFDDY